MDALITVPSKTCGMFIKMCRNVLTSVLLIFIISTAALCGGDNLLTPDEHRWLNENKSRIVLAVETGYPPFVFLDSKGKPSGLAHDYLLQLESKLGVNFSQKQFSSLDEIFSKVRNGEVQIVNAVTKTPGRSEFLSFTEPFISVPNIIVVREERSGDMLEKDLSNLKVSLVKSYAITEYLSKTGIGFIADIVPNDLTAILNVSFGQSDAAVIDLATASYLISQKGITNLRVAGEASRSIQLSMAVPRSETILQSIIQKGLNSITQAERHKINDKWIHSAKREFFSDWRFWAVVGGALFVICSLIIGSFIWNKMLRKQVALQTEVLAKEQEALRQSESRHRAMVESITDVIAIIDQNGINRYKSPNIEKLFGWKQEDVVGEITWKHIHPDDQATEQKNFADLLSEAKKSITSECRYQCKDGSYKWIEFTAINLLHDPDLSGVLLSYHDITERKSAEKALWNEKAFLRSLIDSATDLIYFKNNNSVYLGCNKASEKNIGISEKEQIGKTDFDFFDKEIAEQIVKHDKEVFRGGVAVRLEELITTADGNKLVLDTVKTPIIGQEGQPIGLVGFSRDITERKKAEDEKLALEHQLQQAQKLESLGILAGGIAHDFNNILTVIMGHCYMAQNDMIPEQEYKAAFLKMETAGNRAKDLCRQMLTYAGKSPMEQTRVNLWLLVDEVVKMLQAAIKKNVTIELDLKRDVPDINGDTGQIQQIIMNLIINAADAIGEANGTIRVVLTKTVFESGQTGTDIFGTVIKAGRYACLEVTDTGCGMDEETQKRVFEPFFTTKFTGHGLGMSAIHGIIKSHDGLLQLTSTPGVGTTFKVCFPAPEASAYTATASTATVPLEDASGTILLVEDEEMLRIMGTSLLEALGFSALTASNGCEALEIYRERASEIDVVLLDLIMPVMGGIETYHELRKIDQTVSIIICSGYGVESVEHVIYNDPHTGFVHKPYNPEELRDVMVGMMADC